MKQKLFTGFLFLSFLLISGCAKDENNNEASSSSARISIAGVVYDAYNQPIPGATVQLGSSTMTTNNNGFFSFNNVSANEGRNLLKASKDGYWTHFFGFKAKSGDKHIHNLRLEAKKFDQLINGATGGVLTVNGSSITFPSHAFETSGGTPYNGSVKLAINTLYTSDPDFYYSVPGGDMLAVDQSGTERALYSYGMLGVELQDASGNPLQLADGITATISLPIAATQTATAPATIQLWYFDETSGKWKEEGTAVKQGNNYVGEVSHFTWWNCDYPGDVATIEGYVKDCNGNPVAGAFVFAGNGFYLMTNPVGYFSGPIPINNNFQLYASNLTSISPSVNFTATTAGTVYTLSDFIIPCIGSAIVSGTVEDCEGEPSNGYICFQISNKAPVTLPVINGSYFGLVPSGATATYFATSQDGNVIGQTAISNYPDTNMIGLITLCSTTAQSASDTLFICGFSAPGIGFINVVENDLSYTVQQLTNYDFEISTTGMVDTLITFNGEMPSTPGVYSTNLSFYLTFSITGFSSDINVYPSSGTAIVSHMNSTANSYAFSFSGLCTVEDSTNWTPNVPVSFSYRLNY